MQRLEKATTPFAKPSTEFFTSKAKRGAWILVYTVFVTTVKHFAEQRSVLQWLAPIPSWETTVVVQNAPTK